MANRHKYHKRYMGMQAMCKPTDTGTDQTTGDSSPCLIYPKPHKIHYPSKQTKLNEIIDALQRSNEDLNRSFNITEALTQWIRYQQIYLPISSDYTLHFYWYLNTHLIIAEEQFLLLINVPIQNRSQQLQIYRKSSSYQFHIVPYQPNTKLTTGT